MDRLLQLKDVTLTLNQNVVLRDLSFGVAAREIHALRQA